MSFLVVGAGAIGGVVAAHLSRAGHQVTVVDRNAEHVAAMRESGLRISGVETFTAHPDVIGPDELPGYARRGARPGAVCVAVKGTDTRAAIGAIPPELFGGRAVAVSLQNGWGSRVLAEVVGAERTAAALMTFSAYYDGPGRVVYSGPGSFRIGGLNGNRVAGLDDVVAALSEFHPVTPTDNIDGYLWSKCAVGAFYYATALVSADVPDIVGAPRYRALLTRLVAEVVAVGLAAGVRFEVLDGLDPLILYRNDPASAEVDACWAAHVAFWAGRGQQRTGVWRDLAVRGRATEVTSTHVPTVERGRELGVGTPLLAAVVDMIQQVEGGSRELGWHNLDELAFLDPCPEAPAKAGRAKGEG